MIQQLSNSTPKARKNHFCDACIAIFEAEPSHWISEMTFSEKRIIAKARKNNFQIQVGEFYEKQTGIFDGGFYTFKSIKGIAEICHRLDMWADI